MSVLLNLDPADPSPIYRQIVDEIKRCVAVGVLKPENALPGVRSLAAELKVNPNTVQHAYQTLEQEGAVTVRRGLGTFIVAPSGREMRSRQLRVARQIAERMLREGYRHGLLASDLMAALQEIAPRPVVAGESGPGREEQV